MKAMSRREGSDTLFLTLDWHIALLWGGDSSVVRAPDS